MHVWTANLVDLPLAALSGWAMGYVICLIVGGGMLLISTLLGGDADVDMDGFDIDMDLDVDVDMGGEGVGMGSGSVGGFSLAEWFSMNFVVFFLAAFGLVGTVLSTSDSMSPMLVLASALGAGLVLGQGAHQIMRWIKRTSGGRTTVSADFLDKKARVASAIEKGQRGEIAVAVRGRERFITAKSKHADDAFKLGQAVMIVAYANGLAEVVSCDEFDFVNNP